jgi:hypothetical protein
VPPKATPQPRLLFAPNELQPATLATRLESPPFLSPL